MAVRSACRLDGAGEGEAPGGPPSPSLFRMAGFRRDEAMEVLARLELRAFARELGQLQVHRWRPGARRAQRSQRRGEGLKGESGDTHAAHMHVQELLGGELEPSAARARAEVVR